jgi:hypothetical protein
MVPTTYVRAGTARPSFDLRTFVLRRVLVQGKPVVRRGRKARDLSDNGRPPGYRGLGDPIGSKESNVKTNLGRFTGALMLLASMALTVGAGMRWT